MKHLEQAFENFNSLRILVVGDVMVDSYIRGKVTRISPEAPVPIVSLSKKEDSLGGAANVALNLVALGVQTQMISVIGKDEAGDLLIDLLHSSEISPNGIVQSSTRKTTIKTRVLGDNQHLLRVTMRILMPYQLKNKTTIQSVVKAMNQGLDALIFEDYNKGVLTETVIQSIIAEAKQRNILTTVDPKLVNFLSFKGVSMFKPNLKELREGLKEKLTCIGLRHLKMPW